MKSKKILPLARFLLAALLPWSALQADDAPLRIGFSFNEGTQAGSGNVFTDYYGTQNGSFIGNWAGDTYFRPGFSGEEGDYSITSGGNRVRVDVNNAFGTNWGSFTVETHFTIGELPTNFRRLVDLEGHEILLQKNTANRLRTNLILDPAGNQTAALEEDRWYHAAVVYDTSVEGVEVRFYLDGELHASGPARNPWPVDGPDFLFIGASSTGGSTWNGLIDNVRITQAALSPEEFLLEGFGTDLTQPPPPPEPLPDAAELQFFWTELDLGEIHTRRADGTGQAVLLTGLNRPIGIQVDEENGYLYWSEDGVLGQNDDGRISRAGLDGSDPVTLYAAADGHTGLGNPQGIALDADAGWIYWADYFTGIYRAPLDGTGPVEAFYGNEFQRFTALALDMENDHVYYGNPLTGELYAADINGNTILWGPWGLIGNGLAIDPGAGRLYFSGGDSVSSSDLNGSDVQALATDLALPLGITLDPEKERVFFAERGGRRQIGMAYVDGAGHQPVLVDLDNPFGLALIRVEPLGRTFAQWQAGNFTAAELADESISGPTAAPAGDGIPNLLKFALGLEAKVSSLGQLPVAEMVGEDLFIVFNRAKDIVGVALVTEGSTDLVNWHDDSLWVETILVEDMGDSERVTVRLASGAGAGERGFLRLRAATTD